MKRLLVYLKDYKKECVLAPLFKMLEASFELFVPLVIASIIDSGIAGNNKSLLTRDFIILVMLGLIGLIIAVTAQFFSAKAAVGFATKVRHHLFEHLMGLSFTEIDTLGTSTMITRMTSDVNQAQTGVNMFLRLFLRSPFVVFGAMVMAFTIDVKCALYFVFAIVGLSIVVFTIMALNIPMMKDVQKKLDEVLRRTRENLTGVRVIRAFCREEDEVSQFKISNEALNIMQKKSGSVSGLMNPLTYVLINAAIVLLIYTGAVRVSLGSLTQGEVVALYNYMSQILVELVKLANLIVTLNKAMASANRISEVFAMESSMQDGTMEMDMVKKQSLCNAESIQNVTLQGNYAENDKVGTECKERHRELEKGKNYIQYDHVSLVYNGSKEEALTDINFSIKKGQTVGVIGGTGCGKTSLVHLLPRFYDVSSGAVLINGVDVREYKQEALREKIGIVMQKAVLFKGSIRDNLKWRKENASDEEIMEALKAAQALDVVEKKGGLDGLIEQNGRNLSGGQRKRLSIARALVGSPEILILDDSSSALDFATDASLRKALKEIKGSPTVFIVSQRTSSIQHADLILVLEDGKLAGKGTHEYLLESCEVYKEIYMSQYKKETQ